MREKYPSSRPLFISLKQPEAFVAKERPHKDVL
jgi:hypothetical protein